MFGPRLTRNEGRLIQTVFDRHLEHGKWPTFGEVERALVRDMDVEEVSRSVHRRFGALPEDFQRSFEMHLPPRVILMCDGVDEGYAIIVRALPVILDVYLNKPGKPEVSDADFRERGWSDEDVMRLGDLLWAVHPFGGSGGKSAESWHFEIYPSIKRYAQATTGREFVEIWAKERERPRRARAKSRIAAGRLFAGRRGLTSRLGGVPVHPPERHLSTAQWVALSVLVTVVSGIIIELIFDFTPL